MIALACPTCHRLIEVEQSLLGKVVSCPHCAATVTVTLDMLFGPPERSATVPPIHQAAVGTLPPESSSAFSSVVSHAPRRSIARVGALLVPAYALAASVVSYVVIFIASRLTRGLTIPEKFIERGWTPYVCVF